MTQPIADGSFLSGIRVLELADELGEYCGKVLAGLGADVIKVEPPSGERTRNYGPFYKRRPHPDRSLYFWHYNFGKRGITLDLDGAPGQGDFLRLARCADVVVDTRSRRYLRERGVGYDRLRGVNPGLIYARITPFGDTGPWADYQASDLIHLALGGVMMNCGYDPRPDGAYETPPIAPQMWQSYQIAGEVTAIAIIAALAHRLDSGRGQALATAVHDAVAKNTETDLPDWIYRRSPHRRLTCRHSFPVERNGHTQAEVPEIVPTKDGRWVNPYQTYLSGVGSSLDSLFELLRDSGLSDGLDQQAFGDATRAGEPEVATRNNALIAQLVRSYTFERDIWLDAQKLGLCWAPVRRPEENFADPHWAARETFCEVEYPELGEVFRQGGAKWLAPGLPWRTGPRAPLLGEHTAEVLAALETERPAREREKWPSGPAATGRSAHDATPASDPNGERHAHAAVASDLGQDAARASSSTPGRPWALAGARVIDLGWILASAGGGRFLAALGAEVIKVEHSSKIDMLRVEGSIAPDGLREERDAATAPLPAGTAPGLNRSGNFMEINAGKLAISLNLKSTRGREILGELVKTADILVEGYSPGTLDRMGFGYEALRAINPRLVYVQQSGMGQIGHYGRLKSFGPTAQAISGISDLSGLPEPFPPAGIGYSYLDWFGAYQVALAMLAGLYRQRTTGEGCWIDSSQTESGLYLTGTTLLNYSVNDERWERYGNRSPYRRAAPHGAYRCAGVDRWIAIATFDEDEWLSLDRVLGGGLGADERFASLELRLLNQSALDVALNELTQEWGAVELMEGLQAAGVAAGVCQTAEDRCEWDPQLRHLGWLTELEQSEIGTWRTKTPPTRYSETPPYQGGVRGRHGPNYGEDNQYVYGELLGMTDQEIASLAEQGVI